MMDMRSPGAAAAMLVEEFVVDELLVDDRKLADWLAALSRGALELRSLVEPQMFEAFTRRFRLLDRPMTPQTEPPLSDPGEGRVWRAVVSAEEGVGWASIRPDRIAPMRRVSVTVLTDHGAHTIRGLGTAHPAISAWRDGYDLVQQQRRTLQLMLREQGLSMTEEVARTVLPFPAWTPCIIEIDVQIEVHDGCTSSPWDLDRDCFYFGGRENITAVFEPNRGGGRAWALYAPGARSSVEISPLGERDVSGLHWFLTDDSARMLAEDFGRDISRAQQRANIYEEAQEAQREAARAARVERERTDRALRTDLSIEAARRILASDEFAARMRGEGEE